MGFELSRLNEEIDLSDGYWIDEVEDHPGLRLKVRSLNYKPYQVAANAFYRRNRKQIDADDGFITAMPATGKHIAEHLLLDWDMSNATGPTALVSGGKLVEYSTEVALMVLTAKTDPHGIGAAYRNAVLWAAGKVAERLAADADAFAGN